MGYVGQSRSMNSQRAIENFEVPMSMIVKSYIYQFLLENQEEFTSEEIEFLLSLPVSIWKFIAETTTPSSWHHTGKYYQQTYHYSLMTLAKTILSKQETLDEDYKNFKNAKKKEKEADLNLRYGVITVKNYESSGRGKFTFLGTSEYAGIAKGDWLYYKTKNGGTTSRLKISAKRVDEYFEYPDYKALVKKHPRYKGTWPRFNQITRELYPEKKPAKKAKKKGT